MDIKTKNKVELYLALYNDNATRNEYIYRDRVNERNHKTLKIVLGIIISAIPVLGSLLQLISKLI